ncbi:MAG: hypothetical protein M5U23_11165 [Acidimicrobiia bacterium]|nr:hypothetical protein [Acidimicrobiia bacterium]
MYQSDTTRQRVASTSIDPGPKRRHAARVAQFSKDPGFLLSLDRVALDAGGVRTIAASVCTDFGIPMPAFKFHARRSPYTGACERPRSSWVALLGESKVTSNEANGWGALPVNGAIRLSRSTTAMTLAHELAHHAVFHLDPPNTPAHGRLWVLRFDQSGFLVAEAI